MNRMLTLMTLLIVTVGALAAEEKSEEKSPSAPGPALEDLGARLGAGPRRAMLGIQVDPASGRDGVRVEEVSPGGPAEAAGVRAGDVIVAIDGAKLEGRDDSARELVRRMNDVEPDAKVKLRVLREGKARDIEVIARARGPMFRALPLPGVPRAPDAPHAPPAPWAFGHGFDWEDFLEPWRGGIGGMELASLTPKLGAYFGTEKGVLVVRAPRGGELPLEDGDVILSIDGREPTSGAHAMRILRSYQPGEKLSLKIMRQRKVLTLSVVLPARDEERHGA